MGDADWVDLSVELFGSTLASPLVLASGGLGESAAGLTPYLAAGAGAVVTRTLRLTTRPDRLRFPSPHIATGQGFRSMLNCEWGNLTGWRYWRDTGLPELVPQGPVIVSLSGRNAAECVELGQELDGSGALAFEINVSCSHSGALFGRVGDDAQHVGQLVKRLKQALHTPVIVKLGLGPRLVEIARVAVTAGADAIATTNAIGPGLDLDLESGRPTLGIRGGAGGLSGRVIFPLALAGVAEVARSVNVPVIGIGGVSSYREASKMMMVGATCVGLYTEAFYRGPGVFRRIARTLKAHLGQRNEASVRGLIGASAKYLQTESNLEPLIPNVLSAECQPCGACRRVCPEDAIRVEQAAQIDSSRCSGCGACVGACPPYANALKLPTRT